MTVCASRVCVCVYVSYSLSTWKMQMIFKFGSSVQAACIYPTATLKQVTNGNMCSFYFYKAWRTRGWRAELEGVEISPFRGRAAVWNDSNTQWQLRGGGPDLPRAGEMAPPVPSIQPEGEGPGDETGPFGQWQSHQPIHPDGSPRTPSQRALVG